MTIFDEMRDRLIDQRARRLDPPNCQLCGRERRSRNTGIDVPKRNLAS